MTRSIMLATRSDGVKRGNAIVAWPEGTNQNDRLKILNPPAHPRAESAGAAPRECRGDNVAHRDVLVTGAERRITGNRAVIPGLFLNAGLILWYIPVDPLFMMNLRFRFAIETSGTGRRFDTVHQIVCESTDEREIPRSPGVRGISTIPAPLMRQR